MSFLLVTGTSTNFAYSEFIPLNLEKYSNNTSENLTPWYMKSIVVLAFGSFSPSYYIKVNSGSE